MDVSVIVPTLNEEKHIAGCLKAIKNQKTKLKYEIIVSDGYSKDKTRKIARKYADKVVLEKRKGIAFGRNKGASVAKGKLLVFIDADTILPPDYLETAYSVLKNREIAAVTFSLRFSKKTLILKAGAFFSNLYYSIRSLVGRGKPIGINLCTRKKIFKKVGGFPNVPVEDWVYGDRARKYGRIIYSNATSVTTSSRRLEKHGPVGALFYYIQIIFSTYFPVLRKKKSPLKYKKYHAVR